MNCYELQWKEASINLPMPMWAFTPTIAGDYVTIVGYACSDGHYKRCFQMPVQEIILSLDLPISTDAEAKKWKELSPATHWSTTMIPYSNPPVLIGANGHANQGNVRTSDIVLCDSFKKSWRKVDSLMSARSNVGVALIDATTIIVIGGSTTGIGIEETSLSSVNTVELGKIVPN